jgi:hypothetical protein
MTVRRQNVKVKRDVVRRGSKEKGPSSWELGPFLYLVGGTGIEPVTPAV